jgi:hypothetical protein
MLLVERLAALGLIGGVDAVPDGAGGLSGLGEQHGNGC